MADYAPAVKKKLREGGCWWERQGKGDHEIWYSPHTDRRFPVDNKILSRHTANGIIAVGGPIYRPRPHRLLASSGGAWRGQKMPECGARFMPRRRQQYCSSQCRIRVAGRRFRARKAELEDAAWREQTDRLRQLHVAEGFGAPNGATGG